MNTRGAWLEIEGKILDVDPTRISKQIRALGWAYISDEELKAQWLVNTNWEAIRVRQEGDRVAVEHKKKIHTEWDIKAFQETGFEATNFNDVIKTLLALGLVESWLPSVKRRIKHILSINWIKWTFDIDAYSSLPGFEGIPNPLLEIESNTRENVITWAQLLEFWKDQLNSMWPRELAIFYTERGY